MSEQITSYCPFCAGTGQLEKSQDGVWWFVRCARCLAAGPAFKSEGNAVHFWNYRRRSEDGAAEQDTRQLTGISHKKNKKSKHSLQKTSPKAPVKQQGLLKHVKRR